MNVFKPMVNPMKEVATAPKENVSINIVPVPFSIFEANTPTGFTPATLKSSPDKAPKTTAFHNKNIPNGTAVPKTVAFLIFVTSPSNEDTTDGNTD